MQRVCFVLQVKPERLEEYKERHRSVWPEMQAALRETGWSNYSLFLREMGFSSAIWKPKTSNKHAPGWPRAKSTSAGNARWLASSFNPMVRSPIAPCSRWKKSFICNSAWRIP